MSIATLASPTHPVDDDESLTVSAADRVDVDGRGESQGAMGCICVAAAVEGSVVDPLAASLRFLGCDTLRAFGEVEFPTDTVTAVLEVGTGETTRVAATKTSVEQAAESKEDMEEQNG